MKNHFKLVTTLAIIMIAMAGLVAIQSCKKEQNSLLNQQTIQKGIVHPEKIDDMNAYLKNFGEKMLNSKDNEVLSVEEASWHLMAYQNFMYGDVDDDYTGIISEKHEYNITVSNDMVTLSDLGTLYNITAKDISNFYKTSQAENKRIMYVYSTIDINGRVNVEIALSYRESSRYYYFDMTSFEFETLCDSLFPSPNGYNWGTQATTILQTHITNLGPTSMRPADGERKYYYGIHNNSYDYNDYSGRIYFCATCTDNALIIPSDMCYYLDSYLGIVVENIPNGLETILCNVIPHDNYPVPSNDPEAPQPHYHELNVLYGIPGWVPQPPIN